MSYVANAKCSWSDGQVAFTKSAFMIEMHAKAYAAYLRGLSLDYP